MPEDSTSTETRGLRRWLAPACVGLTFVGMAAQLFTKIDRYAVNILFSDQWDVYAPLFEDYGAWRTFAQQHGPPRLGLGAFVTVAVARATGWDVRAETFVIGCIVLLTAALALYLKWRLFKRLSPWDALIPMLCLGLPSIQAHVNVPFTAYSAVPVLLLVLYAIFLTFKDARLRYGGLAALHPFLVFSCWGFFAGLLAPFLLGYLVLFGSAARDARARRWALLALATSAGSLALFFVDFRLDPAVECFTFPHYPLTDYLWFISYLFAQNSTGVICGANLHIISKSFGVVLVKVFVTLLVSAFVLAAASKLRELFRREGDESRALVVLFFVGFSLIFALSVAFGRACMGPCAANSARYQALLTPAWLGLYFATSSLGTRFRRTAARAFLLALCFLLPQAKVSAYDEMMRTYSEAKKRWRDCYLQKEDAGRCDEEVGLSINTPASSALIQGRLDYLKRRRLNFYAGE